MSFIYPFRMTLRRPAPQTGIGEQPYGGLTVAAETVIATGIACSIQYSRGEKHYVGLPGDTPKQTVVYIFFRNSDRYLVRNGDVMVDEGDGRRFQVTFSGWDSLGNKVTALQLET